MVSNDGPAIERIRKAHKKAERIWRNCLVVASLFLLGLACWLLFGIGLPPLYVIGIGAFFILTIISAKLLTPPKGFWLFVTGSIVLVILGTILFCS